MSSDNLRLAVIGLGFGAVHARVLSEMDGVDLVAVSDLDEKRLNAVTRGRTIRGYGDYAAMLRDERPDAVIVAVPTRLHERVALDVIDAGLPLLVEKPIAPTLAEGRRLVEAAERKGLAIMAGHVERFNPAIVELARRVHGGDAGNLLQLTARRMGPFAARVRDVSVVHDLALHDIDVMRFITGLEVERAFAETQAGVRTQFDDGLVGTLRFAGDSGQTGPVGSLIVNWLTPKKVRDIWVLGDRGLFIADYADTLAPTLEMYPTTEGEGGGLTGRTWSSLANIRGREAGVTRVALEPVESLERELSAFVDAVRTGRPMPVGRRDALAALAVADALAESGRSGLPVRPEQV